MAKDSTRDKKIGTRAEMIKKAKELGFTKAEMEKLFGKNYSKGGDAKKKVPAISISVGMVEIPKGKGKAKMMGGGMANKRQHMYAGGGSVTDNLKPMPTGPKGKGVRNLPDSVQMKMGFDPKS